MHKPVGHPLKHYEHGIAARRTSHTKTCRTRRSCNALGIQPACLTSLIDRTHSTTAMPTVIHVLLNSSHYIHSALSHLPCSANAASLASLKHWSLTSQHNMPLIKQPMPLLPLHCSWQCMQTRAYACASNLCVSPKRQHPAIAAVSRVTACQLTGSSYAETMHHHLCNQETPGMHCQPAVVSGTSNHAGMIKQHVI